jgi:hypothetical protein
MTVGDAARSGAKVMMPLQGRAPRLKENYSNSLLIEKASLSQVAKT